MHTKIIADQETLRITLIAYRHHEDLSQTKLAKRHEVTGAYISSMEAGKLPIPKIFIEKIIESPSGNVFVLLLNKELSKPSEQAKTNVIEIAKANRELRIKETESMAGRVKELRQSLRQSRAVFADLLGVSHPYIGNIEAGKAPVSKKLIEKICNICNIDIAAASDEQFNEQLKALSEQSKINFIETAKANRVLKIKENALMAGILKEFRQSLGLSQTVFADMLGVGRSCIGYIEAGRLPVPKKLIEKIRNMYYIDITSVSGKQLTAAPVPQ